MTLQGRDGAANRVAGYLLFPGCTDSGQFNVYTSLQADLSPLFVPINPPVNRLAYVVQVYIIVRATITNPLFISKLEGYPDRYQIGQIRWLQGNRAVSLHYIDCLNWSEPVWRSLWVSVGNPTTNFPPSTPLSTITYSEVALLTGLSDLLDFKNDTIPADSFSFFLKPGITADIAVIYAGIGVGRNPANLPNGIYLLNQ